MRSPWVCSRAHDSAVLGLGAAARPDAACRSDDGAGLHLRPPRTSARGRVLAMRRDHRRCGHRAGADGDSVSGRVSLVLADASRGAPHAGAGLPEASAVVLGSGTMATRYAPIGEYGVIGDLYTVALVGMDGSIDFLCLPHFDSPSVFAVFVGRSGDGELALRLRSSVPMRVENGAALAEFTLGADTSAWFVLEVVLAQEPSPSEQPDYESDAFKRTVNFWRRWIARSTYGGRWREVVNRSALTLKLLTSRQHGSIVAAPTFGLPETIGGGRNWDYRYTWIRDSSFTLYGLMRLGYTDEAAAFMRRVMARCAELEPDGSLQIMYGLDGRHALPEEALPHFEGYMGSRPVRIGNAAFNNLQLDIYGELLDSVYLYDKYGSPIGYDTSTDNPPRPDRGRAKWRPPDDSSC